MNKNNSKQSGVALLMSLGILALLSILGVAFSTNMRLMERTTRDFVYDMQARYLAEAGVEYAIASLKADARIKFVFSGINPSGANKDEINLPTAQITLPPGNSIRVTAIDTARQININNANQTLLACIPNNIVQNLASTIEITRSETMPEEKFLTKQSICLVPGIGTGTYTAIKNLITTDTYIDENTMTETGAFEPRSAININTLVENTTSETMLREILDAVDGFGSGPQSDNVTKVVNSLKGNSNKPIESWAEFNTLIESANITAGGGLTKAEMENNIKNIFNPNRQKPSATYPTEFCFHSGGTYELTATGTVTKGSGGTSQVVAQKTINTIVKIFDLWNQTTTEQFQGDVEISGDVDGDGATTVEDSIVDIDFNGDDDYTDVPDYARVTWLDNCPLNIDECYETTSSETVPAGYDTDKAVTIQDSLKMGFWDDFSDERYTYSQWRIPAEGTFGGDYDIQYNSTKNFYFIRATGSGPDGGSKHPNVALVEPNVFTIADVKRWMWLDHSIWVKINDQAQKRSNAPWGSDVARLCIKNNLGTIDSTVLHKCPQKHAELVGVPPDVPWNAKYDGLSGTGDSGTVYDYSNEPFYPGAKPPDPSDKFPNLEFWVSETTAGESGTVEAKPHLKDKLNVYSNWAVYKVISKSDSTSASIAYRVQFKSGDEGDEICDYWKDLGYTGGEIIHVNEGFTSSSWAQNDFGIFKFYTNSGEENNGLWATGVRIIGKNGYYESLPFSLDEDNNEVADRIELGSVWGTKTIPKKSNGVTDAADPYTNLIAFQISADNGVTWYPNVGDSGIEGHNGGDGVPDCTDIEDRQNGGLIPTTSGGPGASITGTALKYKAVFTTNDNLSETPVLEDVWITYLSKTKIKYWREN